MIPFLKWPGGKRWFVSQFAATLPARFEKYIEPFLGGGSVFFHLEPERAILGDKNRELMDCYVGVRNKPHIVEKLLRLHARHHSDEYYYRIRNSRADSEPTKAARLIYLNRTCFNGIYRVNKDGNFNVPKGGRESVLRETDDFVAVSHLLSRAELQATDFEDLIDRARSRDFVFVDPPYTVSHSNNGFIKYNEVLFSWDDQIRLAKALGKARDRGAIVIATNANHLAIRELYVKRNFVLKTLFRPSRIAADRARRDTYEELLVLSKNSQQ